MIERRPQKVYLRLRIVAAMLLASIAWGSTVESAHNHSTRAPKHTNASEAANPSATTSEKSDAPRVQTEEPHRSSSRSSSRSECLICQLHHNLTTTLLTEREGGMATATRHPTFNQQLAFNCLNSRPIIMAVHRPLFSKPQMPFYAPCLFSEARPPKGQRHSSVIVTTPSGNQFDRRQHDKGSEKHY